MRDICLVVESEWDDGWTEEGGSTEWVCIFILKPIKRCVDAVLFVMDLAPTHTHTHCFCMTALGLGLTPMHLSHTQVKRCLYLHVYVCCSHKSVPRCTAHFHISLEIWKLWLMAMYSSCCCCFAHGIIGRFCSDAHHHITPCCRILCVRCTI